LDNQVQIVADVDAECGTEPRDCPVLEGEYECTLYESSETDGEITSWNRSATKFRVTNDGPNTEFSLAVADSPGSWRPDAEIPADASSTFNADASFPFSALIAWDPGEECRDQLIEANPDLQTWSEYKADNGLDNLDDWYETFGTSGIPSNPDPPEDLDDQLIVQVQNIPEEGQGTSPEDRTGPDEEIDDSLYPQMSQEAMNEGWITCEAFNE
jgi:hypothetical protein